MESNQHADRSRAIELALTATRNSGAAARVDFVLARFHQTQHRVPVSSRAGVLAPAFPLLHCLGDLLDHFHPRYQFRGMAFAAARWPHLLCQVSLRLLVLPSAWGSRRA